MAVPYALADQMPANSDALSPQDRQALDESIAQAKLFVEHTLPEITAQVPKIIADAKAAREAQELKAEQDKMAYLIWQNSLVGDRYRPQNGNLPLLDGEAANEPALFDESAVFNESKYGFKITENFRIGVYNRDLINGGALLVSAAGAYYLLCQLHKARIDKVFKQLTEDPRETLEFLQKLETAKKGEEDSESAQKNFFVRAAEKEQKITKADKDLSNHLKNKHSLIGYNPFKKELAPGIACFIVTALIAWVVKNKLLVNEFTWAAWQRYVQNGSEYTALQNPPVSVLPVAETAVEMAKNPLYIFKLQINIIKDTVGNSFEKGKERGLLALKNWAAPSIPDAALPALRMIDKVILFAWSLKLRDYFYDSLWKAHLVNHAAEAQQLLLAYEQAKNNHEKDKNEQTIKELNDVEKNMMNFVTQGHAIKGRLPGYFMNSWKSQQSVPWWFPTINKAIAVGAIVALALAARKFTATNTNNGDKHE